MLAADGRRNRLFTSLKVTFGKELRTSETTRFSFIDVLIITVIFARNYEKQEQTVGDVTTNKNIDFQDLNWNHSLPDFRRFNSSISGTIPMQAVLPCPLYGDTS